MSMQSELFTEIFRLRKIIIKQKADIMWDDGNGGFDYGCTTYEKVVELAEKQLIKDGIL